MSERKVLNKYYPPDFDPSKIPKLKQSRNKQYTIRTMAPFNMRCNTCADYIYKGRKFNAKCETAEGENFLGLRIYRFYIRCPKCITEIMFKTDPENTDYTLESGATRLFEAAKLIEEAERREQKQKEEDSTNPMKMLETRTKDSKLEMDIMENLEDLREINTRKEEVDYREVLKRKAEEDQESLLQQEREDEEEIQRLFGGTGEGSLKRLQDDSGSDEDDESPSLRKFTKASDVLLQDNASPQQNKSKITSTRKKISSLIKRKAPDETEYSSASSCSTELLNPTSTSNTETIIEVQNGSSSSSLHKNDVTPQTVSETKESSQANRLTEVENVAKETEEELQGESESRLFASISEGLTKNLEKTQKKEAERKAPSFGLLVGYDESGSDSSSEDE